MSHSSESPIESAIYSITSPNGNLVISLRDSHPRGNLIVEKPTKSASNQQWAVIDHLDGIYTFKSQITKFEERDIPATKRPYARNSLADSPDPYIHGGILDLYATFKITCSSSHPNLFMIGLPGRQPNRVWTIAPNGTDIVLDECNDLKGQLWKFEKPIC